MCCLIFSGRGLAYFGVLVQLLVGLLIVPLVTLLIAFTIGPSRDGTGRFLSPSEVAFVGLYSTGICLLAAVIFRGIRSESLTILYISMASLIILQVAAGVITILSWSPKTSSNHKEVFIRVGCLVLNTISTLAYLCILLCYTNHLRNKLNSEYENEESDFYYQHEPAA